jgi:hypothetical protein
LRHFSRIATRGAWHKSCSIGIALLVGALALAPAAPAAVVGGGGTLIVSPFDTDYDGNLDGSVTVNYGNPSTGLVDDWYTVNAGMNGAFDHENNDGGNNWTWLQDDNDATGLPVYAQWNTPNTFQAGTLIYDVVKYSYSYGTANYTTQVANGNPGLTTADWAGQPGGSGIATGSDGTITSPAYVATLPSVVNANSLRVEFSEHLKRSNDGGNTFANSHAFIDEVTVLPDRYTPVAISSATASGQGSLGASAGVDGDAITQWYHQTAGDEYIEVSFASAQTVDALVVYTYRGFPSDFEVTDAANHPLATVSGVTGSGVGYGEVVPIKFNTPSLTTSLRITFTTNQNSGVGGLAELIPLQRVPEPASLGLMAVGSPMMLRRRRA